MIQQTRIIQILPPSLEELVEEIIAINQAWKQVCEMGNFTSGIANSMADLKNRLQVRLLRSYAPEKVYLQIDHNIVGEQGEKLYGLILRQPTEIYWNAAHLPVQVAQEILSPQEIEQFTIQ
ncbi:MAG: hypothetical protein AB3A66_15945 [Nodularia sp. CChRGM 3473]